MARFVGGDLLAQYMARVRGVDPVRCLAVPVDVGKRSAMALVADHHGEVAVAPFEFTLDEPGVRVLLAIIETAAAERDAAVRRVGVESAGHYHARFRRAECRGLRAFSRLQCVSESRESVSCAGCPASDAFP